MMEISSIDAAPNGGYAQAVLLSGSDSLLFISGQTAEVAGHALPATFLEQCRLAWSNVETRLRAAGMTLDNLVNVTVFLADRDFAAENRIVRGEILGKRTPALTVIAATLLDPDWLVEINAVAAR
jgi:2-iminobutanoate/2-iminopropanoate deaminase